MACSLVSATVAAELPSGYFIWTKGQAEAPETRRIYRMTLPGKGSVIPLTSGEDVEGRISPDGRWVAYAKAKLAGSDYHDFGLWSLYVVSIHGIEQGHEEIKIDDDGYWPSWGSDGALYYNQPDGKHTKIIRVTLDPDGKVDQREEFFSTKKAFPELDQVNEAYLAPDGSWFAARTRGSSSVNGVGAYQVDPPEYNPLARAGSVGCMPVVAPNGQWGLIAGSNLGLRWGHAPGVAERQTDQVLLDPPSAQHKAYHPGISTDGKWVMVAFGTDQDHNAAEYDIYLYALEAEGMKISDELLLAGGGFNGFPHLWVGESLTVGAFRPSSFTVVAGEAVTLSWSTKGADKVMLEGEEVALEGEAEVKPEATTTYQLIAESSLSGDRTTSKLEVVVHQSPQPVRIDKLTIEPEKVMEGESVTVSWKVTNPTTLSLDGQPVAPRGSMELTPALNAEGKVTYLLKAEGHQGPIEQSVIVRVKERKPIEPLEDRGGFVCVLSADGEPTSSHGVWLLLGLLSLAVLRRRRW